MYRGSLFERLSPNEYENIKGQDAIYKSIANNLSKIFSTNAGSAQILKDYGKPDLNNINLSMNDSIEKLEQECEICINKYEPRLLRARVRVNNGSLQANKMEIIIEGVLKKSGQNFENIMFKANLLGSGITTMHKEM
ncbi:25-like lysozyme [Aliarcobacter thereius]|uniref:25-like lysozyme n=1 Tax=Aliarcobacter thereius TaxID=544718 RepID=A0A1C0B348_9BACT|nr:type VI secretion system baseplate subunit TssE [Aliarcobacter thereius]OCL96688.1 25-like lysozyme [Aliarcobacter thereius]